MPLIGVGLALLLTIGAVVLLTRDDTPPRALLPGDETQSDDDVASPGTPSFRFSESTRELVRTSKGRIKARQRRAIERAAGAAERILTDLHTEAFLDPTNWEEGRYTEAFGDFTRRAREHAEARPALLTAGPRAGDRYEQILPTSGRIATRILLDRAGRPTLMVSLVRFSAVASGPEPLTIRSAGQYFFERVDGSWKIVSFHVVRRDTAEEVA